MLCHLIVKNNVMKKEEENHRLPIDIHEVLLLEEAIQSVFSI